MHLRQVECNMGLLIIVKTYQLCLYNFIIQKSKFILPCSYALVNPRLVVKMVIIAEAILIDDLIDHFAAFAAKYFFFQVYFG